MATASIAFSWYSWMCGEENTPPPNRVVTSLDFASGVCVIVRNSVPDRDYDRMPRRRFLCWINTVYGVASLARLFENHAGTPVLFFVNVEPLYNDLVEPLCRELGNASYIVLDSRDSTFTADLALIEQYQRVAEAQQPTHLSNKRD